MYVILVTSNICQTTKEEIRSERIWLSNSPSSISWFSLPPDTYLLWIQAISPLPPKISNPSLCSLSLSYFSLNPLILFVIFWDSYSSNSLSQSFSILNESCFVPFCWYGCLDGTSWKPWPHIGDQCLIENEHSSLKLALAAWLVSRNQSRGSIVCSLSKLDEEWWHGHESGGQVHLHLLLWRCFKTWLSPQEDAVEHWQLSFYCSKAWISFLV